MGRLPCWSEDPAGVSGIDLASSKIRSMSIQQTGLTPGLLSAVLLLLYGTTGGPCFDDAAVRVNEFGEVDGFVAFVAFGVTDIAFFPRYAIALLFLLLAVVVALSLLFTVVLLLLFPMELLLFPMKLLLFSRGVVLGDFLLRLAPRIKLLLLRLPTAQHLTQALLLPL